MASRPDTRRRFSSSDSPSVAEWKGGDPPSSTSCPGAEEALGVAAAAAAAVGGAGGAGTAWGGEVENVKKNKPKQVEERTRKGYFH